jgi:uncharacterized protein (DUF1330 family)
MDRRRRYAMGCYFFANIRITDEALYQKYLDACDAVFAKYHGKYLAVDKAPRVLEGLWNYSRTVLIYFKTETDFNAWYASPDYQRSGVSAGRRRCDTILIRDLDGMPSLKGWELPIPDFWSWSANWTLNSGKRIPSSRMHTTSSTP